MAKKNHENDLPAFCLGFFYGGHRGRHGGRLGGCRGEAPDGTPALRPGGHGAEGRALQARAWRGICGGLRMAHQQLLNVALMDINGVSIVIEWDLMLIVH